MNIQSEGQQISDEMLASGKDRKSILKSLEFANSNPYTPMDSSKTLTNLYANFIMEEWDW
ncbi:MAG: hypothetical protein WAK17_25000 [Candidatus Nitrosopolaris sp.]|jgi:hypothetical protein